MQFSKLISVARREACKRAGRAVMGVALVGAMGYAQAQTYPDRPITFIVPFPAGTAADLSARLFAAEMGRILNQSIVVQNRTGAGGGIAAAQVARAAPDGYTVLVGSLGTHVFNKGLYKNLPYDPVKDFVPVSRFFSVANVLVVRLWASPTLVSLWTWRRSRRTNHCPMVQPALVPLLTCRARSWHNSQAWSSCMFPSRPHRRRSTNCLPGELTSSLAISTSFCRTSSRDPSRPWPSRPPHARH